MFSYFLKPFLGLLTVGGLGTASYFLYKHTISKKEEAVQEQRISEGNDQGSAPGQGAVTVPSTITTGGGGSSGGGTATPGTDTLGTGGTPGVGTTLEGASGAG